MKQSIAPWLGFCKFFFAPIRRMGSGTHRQDVLSAKNIHKLDCAAVGCMERCCGANSVC